MARDWRHRAACRNLDPEIFFPVAEIGPARARQERRAKAVCARCPVVAECLTWALETGQAYGVWGGTTEHERRAQRRPRETSAPRHDPDPGPLEKPRRGAGIRAEGIEALISGATPRAVARDLGVNERTAQRWAARPEVRARRPAAPQCTPDPLSRRSLACAARRTGS
jgi:Transcription factor WhiB/Homeodomain-like domain